MILSPVRTACQRELFTVEIIGDLLEGKLFGEEDED
jgi:hypothetical protein